MLNKIKQNNFYERLKPANVAPLWEWLPKLISRIPVTQAVPHVWRYAQIRELLMESGELISAEEAERRVLILENPAMESMSCCTETLFAGLQLILPGEIAPAHRHTASALRFILEGEGAYTSVDGEPADMSPGDLILTPNWAWHDHGHLGRGPMVWLDGLDLPLVRALGPSFAESYPDQQFPSKREQGSSFGKYGRNMRPVDDDFSESYSPVFHYPYDTSRHALASLSKTNDINPKRGWVLEYIDPTTGGPIIPTMSAFLTLLPKDFDGQTRLTTEGQVFCCAEGTGRTACQPLEGEEIVLEWSKNDQFVIPCWMPHTHQTEVESVLFSFTDGGMQKCLGLYREDQ